MSTFDEMFVAPSMLYKEYSLELVTPMALYGATNQGVPELRGSSFRGVLRYWWRALQTEQALKELIDRLQIAQKTLVNQQRVETLYNIETILFGGAGNESITGKSPVRYSWRSNELQTSQHNPRPHRESQEGGNFQREKGQTKLNMFTESQQAILIQSLKKQNDLAGYYDDVLEVLLMLGSLGRRSRRGFGAIQWDGHSFDTVGDYLGRLSKLLNTLGNRAVHHEPAVCLHLPDQKENRPMLKAVWLGSRMEDCHSLLRKIGKTSSDRRDFTQKKTPRPLGDAEPRFASPLWVTVRKIGGGYYPVISELQSEVTRAANEYVRERNVFLQRLGVEL
ncbi:type III-B CRISPR module RAMP protein Cmr1 [Paenibacillus sp. SYP-B4298]|uniref:type III-B CRISPR module RAMP protein Cmr1 n=1 Tax=Paenibacillus sp. SYP-B4298 TaxID=2996034 RepID=UPI0022DD1BC9|nr:type III-B CRISPR module RAMP protein Cmr1 [Paenibacillus sp. SYP-B4298]